MVDGVTRRIDGRTVLARDHNGSSADRGFSAEERGMRTLLGIDRSLGYLLILWKMMFGRMVPVSPTTVVSTSVRLNVSRS